MGSFKLYCGFRFHPTDEELVDHYLCAKTLDINFTSIVVAEVDMNNVEPWDLPWIAKMGESELYFFSIRDRKYPSGSRANRATEAGYWKATGKDKEVFRANKLLIGMKKTLVFYLGRAPRGDKTNWVMHEYRLDPTFAEYNFPPSPETEWVICRVFKKGNGGKRLQIRFNSLPHDLHLPSLLDAPPSLGSQNQMEIGESSHSHVTCFSDPSQQMEVHSTQPDDTMVESIETAIQSVNNSPFPEGFEAQDQYMRMLIENPVPTNQNDDFGAEISSLMYSTNNDDIINGGNMVQTENSSEDQAYYPAGLEDIGSLWNY